MARVTVEDCLDNVDNRFQLVLVATKRARQLANGRDAMVDWENDKPTVVALREIADGLIGREILESGSLRGDPLEEAEAGFIDSEAQEEEAPVEAAAPDEGSEPSPEQE